MDAPGAVCIPNIGRRERGRRLTFGVAFLCVGVVLAVLLVGTGARVVWRLPLFLPLWIGALGLLQARDKT